MKHSPQLRQILVKTRNSIVEKQKTLVVFDIDSTLFDVSPRFEQILLDFAANPDNQNQFPEQARLLKNIKTFSSDWGITNALRRVGLDGHHPEFQEAIHQWWFERFFSNDYIHFDRPYQGAVEYVNALAQAGADIIYLTGRDQARMAEGTPRVLLQHKFPLDGVQAKLVLKPHKSMDDARFKTDWFLENSNNYQDIYFFENEPVNIELVRKECPQVQLIFFNSTHSGKAETPVDIPHIMDYLCHLSED